MTESREHVTAIADRSTFHKGGRTGFLLIHGLGGTPVEMRFIAQGLARAGFTVYCCQLAGHCGTPDELRCSTRQQWYESVETALDRLRECCDIIIAGGLSMGAILALHLAHKRPHDVQGLTLLAPTLKLDGWSMPWYIHLLHLIRVGPIRTHIYMKERPPYGIKDERIRAFVVESMQSGDSSKAGVFCTPLHSFAHFNHVVAEVRSELPTITAPTLIIHPRDDDIASLENAIRIQRSLGGLVELVVLDDSYHIITLDRQRHIVVDRTVAFARALEGRLAGSAQPALRLQRNRAE